MLWLTWLTVENNFDLFKTFNEWGVKGLKIDFMDRSDQWMVNYYERVAREAAKHHLFVDFHGSFKPAGLEYKYPNVLSYEGVRGMEQMGGCIRIIVCIYHLCVMLSVRWIILPER